MFVCSDCILVWNVLLALLLRLSAQACWPPADNNTRAGVFVNLLAEEIPTVLSVSGLCVFLGLHAWLRQLFYSPVAPRLAPPPHPALVLRRPLLASEACSSSDKSGTGRTPQPSFQSPSELLRANNTPSCPSTLTLFTCQNSGSYLQFTAVMAQQPSESVREGALRRGLNYLKCFFFLNPSWSLAQFPLQKSNISNPMQPYLSGFDCSWGISQLYRPWTISDN